jgi:long-chain acyl-CoA synthetase
MSERTVLGMLKNAANQFATRQYVVKKTDEGWKGMTFPEVRADARALAASLIERGFPRGGAAAILAEGSPEWVVAEFGIIAAGGVSVPLSFRLMPEEIPFRLNHSESRLIFTSKNFVGKITAVIGQIEVPGFTIVLLDDDLEFLENLASESGLEIGRNLLSFHALVNEGRTLEAAFEKVDAIEAEVREDDVVTVSYTSGTTGNPKGIMLMNRNYYVNCKDAVEVFEVPYDYQTLIFIPCDHSFGHTVGIYAALMRGITLYFVDARGGAMGILRNIPKNILETEPTFILSVPAISGNFMKKIASGIEEKGPIVTAIFRAGLAAGIRRNGDVSPRPSLLTRAVNYLPWKLADLLIFRTIRKSVFGNRFRFFVGGGALLERNQAEFFQAIGIPIYQGYGLTEAAPIISANTHNFQKLGSSGKVFPNVECRILDEQGREVPTGAKGEIVVRGENVMKGYLKNESATAEVLVDGWLHTGDLGFIDKDGFLTVCGRVKALLISADGEKYSPEEIEEAIMNTSPYVHQAVVWNDHRKYTSALIVPDRDAVNRFLEKNPGAGPETVIDLFDKLLKTFRTDRLLKNRFPSAWVPATFQLLEEPFTDRNQLLNSSSKIVRYKVVEAYSETLEYMYTSEGSGCLNERNLEVCRKLFTFKAAGAKGKTGAAV